jgi:DNA-directed RNA polymerase subunit K/omega
VVQRPTEFSAFEFVTLAALRAAQLIRGCTPHIDRGQNKLITTAQLEIAQHHVRRMPAEEKIVDVEQL